MSYHDFKQFPYIKICTYFALLMSSGIDTLRDGSPCPQPLERSHWAVSLASLAGTFMRIHEDAPKTEHSQHPLRVSYRDAATGCEIIRWTTGPQTDQHLYFTSPSVTADNRWLVIMSNRDGHPNLYAIDRISGNLRRLTDNQKGLFLSYVYPCGGQQSLSKTSPCLDPVSQKLFYIQDHDLHKVEWDETSFRERKLWTLPPGAISAFTHVSPDGRELCVPCTDGRAFADKATTQWEQMRCVPRRLKEQGFVSRICQIDVETGELKREVEVPFWVTHVQYDPAGTGRIVFNLEGFLEANGKPESERIWCLEGDGTIRALALTPAGEIRTHENWASDRSGIVYHGERDGNRFVAMRQWSGEVIYEAELGEKGCWHAITAPDRHVFYMDADDGLISIIDPQKPLGEGRITPICQHDSIVENQDAHPHPVGTPSGNSIIFTSSREGSCNVYEAILST